MPLMPGLVVMPTVLVNTLLSFKPERSYPVLSPDRLAVIAPMYNEQAGAAQALTSLLEQEQHPDQIAVSINGGTDATYDVIVDLLHAQGFHLHDTRALRVYNAVVETWASEQLALEVSLAVYYRRVSKSESVNSLISSGVVKTKRVLVVDGDTIFHPSFIKRLREHFYRLHLPRRGGNPVLESYGLQSGSVTSFAPPGASPQARFISAGRKAEYAFASVLRSGQARQLGKGRLWGSSRLYTVIGCGFAARRDLFPLPTETETEDHDFSLEAQDTGVLLSTMSARELHERGFRFVVDGLERTPLDLFDAEDEITLKESGNARFVADALMGTEDPPHLSGLIRQIERWNGGGQQNALRRLGRSLKSNVHFAVWTALAENILGLGLLLALPLSLALNYGNPSIGLPPLALYAWLGFDVAFTFLLTFYGFVKLRRAEKLGWRVMPRALGDAASTLLPFMALRWLNPLTYVASATRVIPAFLRSRHGQLKRARPAPRTAKPRTVTPRTTTPGVTWERAYVRGAASRSAGVFVWSIVLLGLSAYGAANLAPYLNPVNEEAWELIHETAFVDMRDFDDPFLLQAQAKAAELEAAEVISLRPPEDKTLSRFCDPSFTRLGSVKRSFASVSTGYEPLNLYSLRLLARLAPLAPYLESAATAYDVPVTLLLMVLINESGLDPLAVGPTEDKGLSQVTSDALTLLKGLSWDETSAFYNPRLVPEVFSVYDPDFSVCAGAAKLAWALRQEGVDDWREAYALYINPVHGLVNGEVSERHEPLVAALLLLEDVSLQLGAVFEVFETESERLSRAELDLLKVADDHKADRLSLREAYEAAFEVAEANRLEDGELYQKLLTSYFADEPDDALAATEP